jgi:hypothetical protein
VKINRAFLMTPRMDLLVVNQCILIINLRDFENPSSENSIVVINCLQKRLSFVCIHNLDPLHQFQDKQKYYSRKMLSELLKDAVSSVSIYIISSVCWLLGNHFLFLRNFGPYVIINTVFISNSLLS